MQGLHHSRSGERPAAAAVALVLDHAHAGSLATLFA
jgi:hypothetical protein